MSWSVTKTGTADDLVQQIQKTDPHVPEAITAAVATALTAFPEGMSLSVSTSGHLDTPPNPSASPRSQTASISITNV